MTLQIKVKYFDKDLPKLEKIVKGSWIDLRVRETYTLKAGDSALLKLNVAIELPQGYEAYIVPRSSTFKKWGLIQTNHLGVVDQMYKGNNDEYMMPVLATKDVIIERGERVCQMRVQEEMPQLEIVEVDSLGNEDRSGFGSTGTK
jgi:dUTP pyrophosphatase